MTNVDKRLLDQSSTRAADTVVRAIEADIRSGALGVGQTLPPERAMMEQFEVSRTVIREALRVLSSHGLIETRPRFRPIVRKPGFDAAVVALESVIGRLLGEPGGVRNLYDTRVLVEGALVREAAKTATADDLNRLERALQANADMVDHMEEFYATDVAFHRVFYEISQNPAFTAVHSAYATWLAPHWSKMPHQKQRNLENLKAHRTLFEAVRTRDPDAAEASLREHLEAAWMQVADTFE